MVRRKSCLIGTPVKIRLLHFVRKEMEKLVTLFLLFLPFTWAQCPESADLKPCSCVNGIVFCSGSMELSRLSIILRRELCNVTFDRFELMDSDIQYLPSNLFFKVKVKEIMIYHTNITHFTRSGRSAFFGLENYLNFLSMRRCFLVDELQWQMIGDLKALTYLDLSYNDLTKIPREWFEHPPPNLRSLILKKNKISYLEKGALTFMHKLVELDLSENQISSLDRNFLPRPGNSLIFLRLSYNNLSSIPEDLFDELVGIRRLYLDSNQISTLPERAWRPIWGDIQTLDFYGNPLLCDCDMQWISVLSLPAHLYGKCHERRGNSTETEKEIRNLETKDFKHCEE